MLLSIRAGGFRQALCGHQCGLTIHIEHNPVDTFRPQIIDSFCQHFDILSIDNHSIIIRRLGDRNRGCLVFIDIKSQKRL